MRFFQYIILIAACYALTVTHGTHAIAKACQPNKHPSWLTTPQIDETCYYGINSAQFSGNQPDDDTIQKAKDRAIRDLSYSLSVNIQSYFEEHLSEYDDNSVKSSLMLSSRLVLDGIREKDHWTDCNQHAYWMMVGIDKQKADKQVRDQNFINQVLDRLEHRQDEIQKGIQSIAELSNQRMKRIEGYFKHINQLSEAMDQKIASAGKQSRENYQKLFQQFNEVRKQLNQLHQNKEQRLQKIIDQQALLLNKLTTVSSTIQSDYLLSFVSDDIRTQDQSFKVQISPSKGQGADYYEGERITFKVSANRNCYIKVMYIQSTGEETLLLPNVYDRNNYVKAGQSVTVGKLGELLILAPFGKDTISVEASEMPFPKLDEQLNIAAKSNQHYLTRSLSSPAHAVRTRAVGVGTPLHPMQSVASDTCFIVSHSKYGVEHETIFVNRHLNKAFECR